MQIYDKIPVFSKDSHVVELDGAKSRTLRAFYPRIAKALFFPDYFGKNLDALLDCLCSLEVVGKADVVLLIKNYEQFLSKETEVKRKAALEVLADAQKKENRYDGVTLRVVGVKATKL
jgi:RNAse (barnase) inhibitor barstar